MVSGFGFWVQVPSVWSGYVKEVDEEREAWLNSFTQAPLRVPMPPELEQLWDEGDCNEVEAPGSPRPLS